MPDRIVGDCCMVKLCGAKHRMALPRLEIQEMTLWLIGYSKANPMCIPTLT